MSTTRTLSAIILLAIGFFGGAEHVAGATPVVSSTTVAAEASGPVQLTVHNETGNDQPFEIVGWAVERYEMIGLRLPDGEVTFHPFDPSLEACGSHGGLHTVGEGGHRIDICAVGVPSRRRLMLHEFAHAWTHENLSGEQVELFLSRRGLVSWNEPDVAWEDRGTEHAAEIIAWGLSRRCDPDHMLIGEDPASLAAAFVDLTGSEPICQSE